MNHHWLFRSMIVSFISFWYFAEANSEETTVNVISETKSIPGAGRIRYHYSARSSAHCDDNKTSSMAYGDLEISPQNVTLHEEDACQTVVIIGVGTAMSIVDYNDLAMNIVLDPSLAIGSMVVVIADPWPYMMVKMWPKPYAKQVVRIVENLSEILSPICSDKKTFLNGQKNDNNRPHILVGGHSASGMAAFEAYRQNLFNHSNSRSAALPIDGFIGLDPFFIKDTTTTSFSSNLRNSSTVQQERHLADTEPSSNVVIIDVPTLYWGFSETTCSVKITEAAGRAYELSNPAQRIFYQIQTDDPETNESTNHCSFTDNGCNPMVCDKGSSQLAAKVRHAVSLSLSMFVKVLRDGGQFSAHRGEFGCSLQNNFGVKTRLFYNEDKVVWG